MYGMGLGISVWDGSRDQCMGMVLEVGVGIGACSRAP